MTYSTGLVNVVGVNNLSGGARPLQPFSANMPQLNPQGLQTPEFAQQQDITDEKFAQVRADTERQYQSVLEGLRANANINQSAIAARGTPERFSGLSQIFDTVASAAMQYKQMEDERAARRAEEQQAAYEQYTERQGVMARAALEELFIESQGRIREYGIEHGTFTTRDDMRRILSHYNNLPPDILEGLYSFAGTEMRQIESLLTDRQLEAAREQQQHLINGIQSELKYQFTSALATLENPHLSQEQSEQVINTAFQQLAERTADFDPMTRIQIAAPILDQLADSSLIGTRARVLINQRRSDLEHWYNYVETQLRPQFGDDPNFEYYLQLTAPDSIRDLVDTVPTNLELLEGTASYNETRQRLVEQQLEANARNSTVDYVGIAGANEMAWLIAQGDAGGLNLLNSIQRKPENQRTAQETLALQIYQQIDQQKKEYNDLRTSVRNAINEQQGLYVRYSASTRPATTSFVDPETRRAFNLVIESPDGGAYFAPEGVTQDQILNAEARVAEIRAQMDSIRTNLANLGFNLDNPTDRAYINQVVDTARSYQQAQERAGPLNQQLRQEVGLPPNSPQGMMQRGQSLGGFNRGNNPPVQYTNRISSVPAPSSNFRSGRDTPISRVVLHETVGDMSSTDSILTDPSSQVSYHFVIDRNGQITNYVNPEDTAYGAYMGNEGSIHVSLESPEDGRGNEPTHSGYTPQQYEALAELLDINGWSGLERITHKHIADEHYPGERSDPRSFDDGQLATELHARSQASAQLPVYQPRIPSVDMGHSIAGFNWSPTQPPPGYSAAIPQVTRLARLNGSPIPFQDGYNVQVMSGYGSRLHPVHGDTRMHHGIDYASPQFNDRDAGAISVAGGYVINAFDWSGYGGTVLVETPTGHIEQYSHLRSFNVQPGDFVNPGGVVGVVGGGQGDPMAGTSTGRHLHFQVWAPGTEDFNDPTANTLPPQEYLATIQQYEFNPVGTGLPPTRPPSSQLPTPDAVTLGNGNFFTNLDSASFPFLSAYLAGDVNPETLRPFIRVPSENVYPSGVSPVQQGLAPINREAYPNQNDPYANYGYQQIADDPQFARALAQAGDELGIPAQWLADVIAYESAHTFSPSTTGPVLDDGSYGVGLIQLMTFNMPGMGLTVDQVMNMSPAEYTRRVIIPYLSPFRGQIKTIEDLYESIFRGRITNPQNRAQSTDEYNVFQDIVRQFGSSVGRRYRTSYDNLQSSLSHTHESYTNGCPICQQQYNRFGAIVPHESIG